MNTCLICYEPLKWGIKILNCNHRFHKKCIKKWTIMKPTCPYCLSINKNKFIVNIKFNDFSSVNKYTLSIDREKILLFNHKTTVYKILYIKNIKNIYIYCKKLYINYNETILVMETHYKNIKQIWFIIKEAFTI